MNNINLLVKMKAEEKCVCKIIGLILLFFGTNIYLSFATDTYSTLANGFEYSAKDMFFRNGRPIVALMYEIYYLSGLAGISFYYISSVLALFFLGCSLWLMQKILKPFIISENQRIFISFISIANIFIIEYFMFIEKCAFMLAILFNILSIYYIYRYLEKRKIKYYICSVVVLILAFFTYQGTIALFITLSMPFAYKYADSIKKYFLNILHIGLVYFISALSGICAFKFIFKSSRINGKTNYFDNAKHVIESLKYILVNTFEIVPKHFFELFLFVIFSIYLIYIVYNKNKIRRLIHLFIIILTSCFSSTATIIQGSGWWAMRVVYPIASLIGSMLIDFYINDYKDKEDKVFNILDKVISFSIIVFLIGQYISFNKVYIDKYKLNMVDKYRCEYIGQAISEYQEKSGQTITKIAFYYDANTIYPFYDDLYCNGDLIVSSFYRDWSNISAINYYLGTNYEKAECEKEYFEYFQNKDWEKLSQEQLIFEGDTLQLCIY